MSLPFATRVQYHIAWRLLQYREARGLSRDDIAQALNVSVEAIYRIETGVATLGSTELWQFSSLFGLPPSVLFDGLPALDAGPAAVRARRIARETAPAADLVKHYLRIKNQDTRRRLGTTIRTAAKAY